MNKIKLILHKLFRSNCWSVLAIFLLGILVMYANRQEGKYLLGWDSVWSEANFGLSLDRAWGGVWQEFQGLGLQGGHGYVSDLIHSGWLWLIARVIPLSDVRFVSIMLMWTLGGIGAYYLVRKKAGKAASLLAAVIYLLHPFTIQQFYVPHDAFTWFFALLPWSLMALINVLEKGGRLNLMLLFTTQLLLSFAGFLPPQMVAYALVVGILLISYLLMRGKAGVKRVLLIATIIFATQSYWLLPFAQYTLNGSSAYLNSKLNRVTTPENTLKSENYGGWVDLITGRGYYFESLDVVDDQLKDSAPILSDWEGYWGSPTVKFVFIALFGLGVLGFAYLAIKGNWWEKGIVMASILAAAGIATSAWPLNWVDKLFHGLPLLDQAFRIGFTKFSILYVLFFSFLVVVGFELVGKLFKRANVIFGMALIGIIVFSAWPVFEGNLFYKRMLISLPNEYLNLKSYMNVQITNGRVAILPVNNYNGWYISSWGYTGSGFLFYGIDQPIMDRAFDVWSPYNETFYNQLSTALYEGNKNDVVRVLGQYDVKYVLLDESVIAPGQDNKILRREETKQMARDLGWQERFQEGFLTVWEVPGDYGQQFVSAPERFTFAEGETTKVRREVIWKENGTYVSGKGGVIYPFADLMREEVNGVSYDGDSVTMERKIGSQEGQRLIVPGLEGGQKIRLSYTARLDKDKLQIVWQPLYTVNGQTGPKLADQEFPAGGGNGVWVKMNESRPLWVEIDKEIKGDAELTTDEAIKLNVYKGEGRQQVVSDLWLERNIQENCGEGIVCISIPLAKPENESLVQVVQKYAKKRPIVCIDREGDPYRCEETVEQSVNPIITTIDTKSGEQDWLDIAMKGNKTELMKELDLPWVLNFPILKSEEIDPVIWQEFTEAKEFSLQGPTIKVEIETEPIVYDLATLGSQEITNCDVLKRGSVTKENNKYTANERGAGCDYVEMKNLDIRVPYLMRMRGEDVTGRSLKFFLHNTGNGRNDIEYLLDKGSFDQNFAVLPWGFPGRYTLNVETRSFGQETINILEPVEMRYFPLEQIASARIVQSASIIKYSSNLEIEKVIKKGTWLYWVDLDGSGLLRLSQGFDNGWVGIALMEDGGFDLSHVKVDGWANGWIVPQDVNRVVIFYWPQLLEYLGFALLGVTILVIVRLQK